MSLRINIHMNIQNIQTYCNASLTILKHYLYKTNLYIQYVFEYLYLDSKSLIIFDEKCVEEK